jgi:hypothetical protein
MAPLVGGLEQPKASKRDVSQFLRRQWETAAREAPGERYDLFYSRATIIAGMYLGYPWSRQDLAHMAYISRDDAPYFEPRKRSFFERFITQLGPEGKAVIDELKSLESSIEQNHDPNTDAE